MNGSKYVHTSSCTCTIQMHARSIPKATYVGTVLMRCTLVGPFPVQPFPMLCISGLVTGMHVRRYHSLTKDLVAIHAGWGKLLVMHLKEISFSQHLAFFLKAIGIMGIHPGFHRSYGPIADLRCGVWMISRATLHIVQNYSRQSIDPAGPN